MLTGSYGQISLKLGTRTPHLSFGRSPLVGWCNEKKSKPKKRDWQMLHRNGFLPVGATSS